MDDQQKLNSSFTLINIPEVEKGRYYIRHDGEIFDDKEIKFLVFDDIEDYVYLNNQDNTKLVFFRKKELLLKVFLSCFYGDDCSFVVKTLSKANIENIKDLELRL